MTKAMIVLLTVLSTPPALLFLTRKSDLAQIERSIVAVLPSRPTPEPFLEIDPQTIRGTARQRGVAVEQIEQEIARGILQGRDLSRRSAAGYGPGSFIVSDAAMKMANSDYDPASAEKLRNTVIEVSRGAVTDLSHGPPEDGKFVFPAKHFRDERNLYIRPVDVSNIGGAKPNLVKYSYAGTYLEGNAGLTDPLLESLLATPDGRTGWTGLSRLFNNHPSLGRFLLDESEDAAGNLTTLVPQATVNARVGEHPATLVRVTDADGNTMSRIDWAVDHRRTYSLTIEQIDNASIAALVMLANAVADARQW